jgi:large subunit ribosomal protein L6
VKFLGQFDKTMQSLLVPSSVSVSLSTTHIRRAGPRGVRLRPLCPFNVRGRSTPEGRRLVVSLSDDDTLTSTRRNRRIASALSHLSQALQGVSRGYRRRLRLVGVGFRAVESDARSSVNPTPVTLKLGYSHDVVVSRLGRASEGISLTPSRLDGRSKGTLLSLEGPDLSRLHHAAITIRALRAPDAYKGKGIHFDREKLALKKGKRET